MTDDDAPKTSRRRRGGQPGNSNALKHGFYSRHMQALEMGDLDAALAHGLEDEIAMLRVATRRLFALATMETLDEGIAVAGMLGMCAIRLAGLMKAYKAQGGGEDAATSAINQALTEVMREMRLYV
jgi:hypothetical protein